MTQIAHLDPDSGKPTIFISHCHEDSRIADVIRRFLESTSLGQVDAFQSSETGQGLRIGGNVGQELLGHLGDAETVILVYTSANRDWSYCMWECGVALDPSTPDTSISVFQFTDQVPGPFLDKVRVDVRKPADIQNFVTQFLTSSNFLPRHGKPIAPSLSPDGPEIIEIADEFFDELRQVSPSSGIQPDQEWPVFSYLQLELTFDQADIIKSSPVQEAREVVLKNAIVRISDQEAAGHFGMMSVPVGTRFSDLVSAWKSDATQKQHDWIESLLDQVVLATRLKSPDLEWKLMRSEDDQNWYAPSIRRVLKLHSRSCMQFDVEFLPFHVEKGATSIVIPIPE